MVSGARYEQRSRRAVPVALLTAVAAISFAAIFFRLAQPTHPLAAAAIRLLFATIVLAPFTVRARLAGRLPNAHIRAAAVAGVLYGVHFGAWVWSLGMTTVAASVTLVTATPVLLAAVAGFSGRDVPVPRLRASLALAVVGVMLIGGADFGRSSSALMGDALALVGAAAMAGYLVLVRGLGGSLHVLGFSGIACAVGGVVLGLTGLLAGVDMAPSSITALGYLALAALLPQVIGHSLLTWSLRHATPVAVGVATVGEPVGATLLGWFWLAEAVPVQVGVGCVVTLLAVVLAVRVMDVGRTSETAA